MSTGEIVHRGLRYELMPVSMLISAAVPFCLLLKGVELLILRPTRQTGALLFHRVVSVSDGKTTEFVLVQRQLLFLSQLLTLSCGVRLSTMVPAPADFMPRSSLPVPPPPVFLGPSTHCTSCLSTIFLVLTSCTLTVPVGKLRGIPMNTHFSPFGAIICSRTFCRAYPTAPNDRK